jgi:hypothetical protein
MANMLYPIFPNLIRNKAKEQAKLWVQFKYEKWLN